MPNKNVSMCFPSKDEVESSFLSKVLLDFGADAKILSTAKRVFCLVEKGLKTGAVSVSDCLSSYGVCGCGCEIGGNAFYFTSGEYFDSCEEYFCGRNSWQVVADIAYAILCFLFDDEDDAAEGLYYVSYLERCIASRAG